MDIPETLTPWQPVAGSERYAALDVLRGLALFGVLIVNLEMAFRVPFAAYILGERNYSGSADHVAGWLIEVVLQTKAFTLFSFSFGIGMAVQAERARSRGRGAEFFLARRMLVLLGLGLCHMFLIWNGDILTLYAVCGLLLVPLVRLPSLVLVLAGIVAIVLNFVIPFGRWMPTYDFYFTHAEQAKHILAEGNFWEIMALNRQEAVQLTAPLVASVSPRTVGMMLLGLAAWRSGLLRVPQQHRVALWCVAILGVVISGAAMAWLRYWPGTIHITRLPTEAVEALSYIPLALAYAAAVFLWLGSSSTTRIARPLAAVGQMALTNYLTQSVVLSFVFYGYGIGLIGKLGPATASLIGIGLYVVQLVLSPIWLTRFQFGPVEWLWRSLTYGKWQRMVR